MDPKKSECDTNSVSKLNVRKVQPLPTCQDLICAPYITLPYSIPDSNNLSYSLDQFTYLFAECRSKIYNNEEICTYCIIRKEIFFDETKYSYKNPLKSRDVFIRQETSKIQYQTIREGNSIHVPQGKKILPQFLRRGAGFSVRI